MNRIILVIGLIIVLIDQITKILASLYLSSSIRIIDKFLYLTYVENTGAAFGILSSNRLFIIIITLGILFLIYHYMYSFKRNKRNNLAFGLLIGGIFGNLIDRIFKSYVIDFIDIYLWGYDFPVFNISDIAIVVGCILLFIAIIRKEDSNEVSSRKK